MVLDMAAFIPEWPYYHESCNRPATTRNHMMYAPGCIRFQHLPQPFTSWTGHNSQSQHHPWRGYRTPWEHQNPQAFMEIMTELFGHDTPSRQNQNQTRRQAERPGMQSGLCCKEERQDHSQPEGGARPKERTGRTARVTSSPQYPKECPRKSKEDSRRQCCDDNCCGQPSSSSTRSGREEHEASNPFEFIHEILGPMFADIMSQNGHAAEDAKQHQEKPNTNNHDESKEAGHQANHPYEQAYDDAFDLMLDMVAPYMDDISAFLNPGALSDAGIPLSNNQREPHSPKLQLPSPFEARMKTKHRIQKHV